MCSYDGFSGWCGVCSKLILLSGSVWISGYVWCVYGCVRRSWVEIYVSVRMVRKSVFGRGVWDVWVLFYWLFGGWIFERVY